MSFFDFSGNGEKSHFDEEDDTDYDALNSETFGENLPALDWEEVHEKLASELEKRNSFDDDSNEISKRVANFLFNDEGEEDSKPSSNSQPAKQEQQSGPPTGPVKWWINGGAPQMPEQPNNTPMDAWWQKPQSAPRSEQAQMPPKPAKILTVEELEEKMRREAAAAVSLRPIAGTHGGPPHGPSHRLPHIDDQDLQRIPNHQIQNGGTYGRGRGQPIRGRYRPDMGQEKPYHAVHHPFPPYPGAQGPAIIHPQLRHPGPNNYQHQRYFDPRLPGQQGQLRHPRPQNQFYPNHNLNYQQNNFYPRHQGPQGAAQMNDEYAGLMSPQEKQWLGSIQMMQLNTHQPYQDDYYFTVYQQRQGCQGRKICGTHGQKREQIPQKPASTYTPLQFENSLGKLQIGSVTAPRKIIDMELVESLDHNTKQQDKKSKQILLEIEELYNLVLKIEDAFNPQNTLKQDIDISELQEKLLSMVTGEGKLVQIMSIRKGKKLILRLLQVLVFPSKVLHGLMVDLVPITRKDSEHNMLLFLPAIRNYLLTADLATLVDITNNYDNQFLLSNKFTVSVMANLIERANVVQGECTNQAVLDEWKLFLIRLLESTRLWNQPERPVVAVEREVLVKHLKPVIDQVTPAEYNTLLSTLQPATVKPSHTDKQI